MGRTTLNPGSGTAAARIGTETRSASGFDVHRLEDGEPLWLGGVRIPHHQGLSGHSDADVALHAITDAVLGAAALGDIGRHFPDTDAQWKDADSIQLLKAAVARIAERGFRVSNVDVTVIAQKPKLLPHIDAMRERVTRGEQILVLLNRRGYAPVLHCPDCDWKSQCPHCSAFRVFHKLDRTLRCHHCSFTQSVPRACPACGNADIQPLGRGTEQLEEHLAELLSDVRRTNGEPLRISRIDADSTRLKGELERQLAEVHAGEVDVLVGTQMIAKGHDFRRMGMVVVADPDGALFSADFRAPERLFDLLLQAAGRAGRAERSADAPPAQVWIQTRHPDHAMFDALKRHDAGATFLFSLGPDHTGRALRRVFRPGFLQKVSRTSVVSNYGIKTLLYGTLLPGPDIGKRCAPLMRAVRDAGHEVGIR